MRQTIEFIDALKASNGGASDYALAKILGVSQQTVSKWRTGKDFLGDSSAIKVAEMLQIDAGYVVACAHAERAKQSAEKAVWQRIAATLPAPRPDLFCIMLSRAVEKIAPKIDLSIMGQIMQFS